MMAQQEKLHKEIEEKQKLMIKKVVEKVKKENEENQKQKLEEWLEAQRKEKEAEEERQHVAKRKQLNEIQKQKEALAKFQNEREGAANKAKMAVQHAVQVYRAKQEKSNKEMEVIHERESEL